MFQAQDSEVYEAALELLPEGFYVDDLRYCQREDCVFNDWRPGAPARINHSDGGSFCYWCDPDCMTRRLQRPEGGQAVRKTLTMLERAPHLGDGMSPYQKAVNRLPEGFVNRVVLGESRPRLVFFRLVRGSVAGQKRTRYNNIS